MKQEGPDGSHAWDIGTGNPRGRFSNRHDLGAFIEGASLSGHERNHLFLNLGPEGFQDVAGISGLDDPADGRAAGILDYDRDGWLDFAVVNSNTPLLQLFRNQIGERPGGAGMIAVRYVGANRSAAPNPGASARDGYGAVVEARVGDATLLREHRAGEGFAAQNSSTQLIGIGEATSVDGLRVRWPSGKQQEFGSVPEGSLVTLFEEASESPDGSGWAVESYRREVSAAPASPRARTLLRVAETTEAAPPIRLLTTMATWCEKCRSELPQVALLREAFVPGELGLVGVPVDEDDDAAKLAAYRREHGPAYRLLDPLSREQRERVQKVVVDALRLDALPATIITDGKGQVLQTLSYVPSVSELRELLAEEGA